MQMGLNGLVEICNISKKLIIFEPEKEILNS